MGKRSGHVSYEDRAFDQDAQQAMRGDIIRALIELITNSDDAYGESSGSILVRIRKTGTEDYPIAVSVHDHARGLDADGLEKCFAILGGQSAKVGARGLLGRGAKDVAAFGFVEFASISQGTYSKLWLKSGEYNVEPEDVKPTDQNRTDLVLQPTESGLTATIWVDKKFKIASGAKIQEKIANHAQLRDLISRRLVRIEDHRNSGIRADVPSFHSQGEIVLDEDITIDGYEDPIHLTLRRLPQPDSNHLGNYSQQGILVKSGVSIFENTWFGLDGITESSFFSGVVEASQIADIIRAFDKQEELGGNMSLLSRSRDGLQNDHPYYQALIRAITPRVKPFFEELSKEMNAQKKQGERLTSDFNALSTVLRGEIERALADIDEDDLPGGPVEGEQQDFYLIPPVRRARRGERLTFIARSTALPEGELTSTIAHQHPEDTVASISLPDQEWRENEQIAVWSRTIHLVAGESDGIATIQAEVDGKVAKAQVVVFNGSGLPAPKPVLELMFDTPVASVSPMKTRHLALIAPIESAGLRVVIDSTGYELESIPQDVTLQPDANGVYSRAKVTCVATSLQGSADITAQIVGQSHQAKCKLEITMAAPKTGLDFKCELSAFTQPNHRSQTELDDGTLHVTVFPIHSSFNSIFGKYDDVKAMFANENSPEARAILSEIIGFEIAQYLTNIRYVKFPEELNDAPRVLNRQQQYQMQFQGKIHKVLSAETVVSGS